MARMTRKQLIAAIEAHLRRSREGGYAWSQRVMGDKTFLWKLKNYSRNPYPKTINRIARAIAFREKKMARQMVGRRGRLNNG